MACTTTLFIVKGIFRFSNRIKHYLHPVRYPESAGTRPLKLVSTTEFNPAPEFSLETCPETFFLVRKSQFSPLCTHIRFATFSSRFIAVLDKIKGNEEMFIGKYENCYML